MATNAASNNVMFSSNFEGGNLGTVTAISDGSEYDIEIHEDSSGPQHRWWFHFQMCGGITGQDIKLNLIIRSKARELYRHGMTPVIRSTSHAQWAPISPQHCSYQRHKHGHSHVVSASVTIDRSALMGHSHVVPASVAIDRDDAAYEFAYTYPYSYSHLQQWLMGLSRQHLPHAKRQTLCTTPQNRCVDMLTIEEAQANVGAGMQRPVVVVTARVHPGETPGSFAVQGLLAWLLSTNTQAVHLRQAATVVVVPMLNPDGVALGKYRTDAEGQDLNRLWGCTLQDHQPALYHTLQLLHRYDKDPAYSLDLFLDIHGHSASPCSFLFCNTPTGPTSGPPHGPLATDPTPAEVSPAAASSTQDHVQRLPELLNGHMPGFSLAATRFDEDARKVGSARQVIGDIFKHTLSYTLEIAMFHTADTESRPCHLPTNSGEPSMDQSDGNENAAEKAAAEFCNSLEGYNAMGEQLGVALAKMYGHQQLSTADNNKSRKRKA